MRRKLRGNDLTGNTVPLYMCPIGLLSRWTTVPVQFFEFWSKKFVFHSNW